MSLPSLFSRVGPHGLFQRSSHCVLTTITPAGAPQARRVRVATCSRESGHLWFVVARESGIVSEVAREPSVMLSALNPETNELVHVLGTGSVMGPRHSPLYLAPGFDQAPALSVVGDELDISLLRVDVSDNAAGDETGDTQPPHRIFRLFQASRPDMWAEHWAHASDNPTRRY